VTCAVGFLGSIIFTTKSGLIWLDIVDHFLTHYGLMVVGIAECILVGWFFKTDLLRKHINKISSIQLGTWWDFLIKFFVPIVLGIILVGDLYNELKTPYEGYSWTALILIGWDWLLLTLIVAFIIGMRPWKTGHHKTGGRAAE
jgi:NSS family neurotransmitter:Na+ symporter